jgi:hypothetical protein
MRRIRLLIASLAVSAALLFGPTATATAYGGGADHDMWQVGISFNCNNPDFCGPGLGGFWAWAEFDRSAAGSETWGDVEGAGCFHTVGGGGGAGAVHVSLEIESWTIEQGSAGPQTFFASGEETDSSRGVTTTFDVTHFDTGVPAVPGHYSAVDVFGFDPPPGIAIEIQVAFRPAK